MYRILQVFNQYLERGGEEVWVEKIPQLAGDGFEFEELRFCSENWVGAGAPSRLDQVRWIGDNPESRARLRAAVARFEPGVLPLPRFCRPPRPEALPPRP
jgi:hypothetical protein